MNKIEWEPIVIIFLIVALMTITIINDNVFRNRLYKINSKVRQIDFMSNNQIVATDRLTGHVTTVLKEFEKKEYNGNDFNIKLYSDILIARVKEKNKDEIFDEIVIRAYIEYMDIMKVCEMLKQPLIK